MKVLLVEEFEKKVTHFFGLQIKSVQFILKELITDQYQQNLYWVCPMP